MDTEYRNIGYIHERKRVSSSSLSFHTFSIFFQDPVVTRIKRDQKIPIIGFVANTGGLLGLCMGFSLVSAFEIVYHCMMTLCWKSFHFYRRRTMRNSYQMQQELQGPSSLVANSACKNTTSSNSSKANTNSTSVVQTAQEQEIGTISKNTQCDEAECSNGKTGKRASLELLI